MESSKKDRKIQVTDFIGGIGVYQLSLILITFIRYVQVAMMVNVGPLIAPEIEFWCEIPKPILLTLLPNLTHIKEDSQRSLAISNTLNEACQISYDPTKISSSNLLALAKISPSYSSINSTNTYQCSNWIYEEAVDQGRTMTSEYGLVCSRDWLRSLYQTLVFAGIVLAHIFWGTFSDQYGRYQAQKLCIVLSLVFGIVASFAPNYWIFVLSRSIGSFSDLGIAMSLSTTMVETIGKRYRGVSVVIVNVGWAMGVMIMPWVVAHFENFKLVMLMTVICHVITIPWLMFSRESIRWLLANKRFHDAQVEMKRIRKWSIRPIKMTTRSFNESFDMLISQYDYKYLASIQDEQSGSHTIGEVPVPQNIVQSNVISVEPRRMSLEDATGKKFYKVNSDDDENRLQDCVGMASKFHCITKLWQLFSSGQLLLVTLTLSWTIFNSELLYASFIHINLEVGEDVFLNFILGGLMEISAAFTACILLTFSPRKYSMVAFWLLISALCFALSLTNVDSNSSVWILAVAKFAQSTVSTITCLVAFETFPTEFRQTGSGLCDTLGKLGALVAPIVWAVSDDIMGLDKLLLIFSFPALSAAILTALFVKETKGCELKDSADSEDPNGRVELLAVTNVVKPLGNDESLNENSEML